MTALHGFANASGARTAVLSVPVRRTLLLLGLLCGALAALWLLGSASAQAAEAEDLPLAGGTGLAETTAQGGGTLAPPELAPEPTLEPVVPEPAAEAVEPVHETLGTTLDQVTTEVGGHIDETVAPSGPVGTDKTPVTAPDQESVPQRTAAPAEEAEPEPETAVQVHEGPHVLDGLPETGGPAEPAASATVGATTSDADPAERTASSNASAHTGTVTGPNCADFPSRAGLPAPAPGLDQAARHFLRAVPSAAADEPTFAPD
ncbi:MAG: hypothetical protein JK586_07575 [Nocardiopsis sp. BM-2018]|uniref:Uncharacterized protein n=1 Tax=Nocardiopsis metallicus TaxID=179819 RepID=A0A840WQE9_9ACTN|nr:hypothetical protein [Nocardiopsis metallicus]MBB5494075.1 hypothetical protein [Nocardiopsis metallicus]QRN81287.1 MAG: hypothetical protein JK586_07575 [Nocardiopsis sp. BM-2018]